MSKLINRLVILAEVTVVVIVALMVIAPPKVSLNPATLGARVRSLVGW